MTSYHIEERSAINGNRNDRARATRIARGATTGNSDTGRNIAAGIGFAERTRPCKADGSDQTHVEGDPSAACQRGLADDTARKIYGCERLLEEGRAQPPRHNGEIRENLPDVLVTNLLEFRTTLLPDVAASAVEKERDNLVKILKQANNLDEDPEALAEFDWGLQLAMAEASANPIYRLILNDFGPVFNVLAMRYFSLPKARESSKETREGIRCLPRLRNRGREGSGQVNDGKKHRSLG